MSAPFIIPFNFQPVNTGGSSTTYTVPAGKYACISYTLNVTARASTTNGALAIAPYPTNSNSASNIFWVKEGDVVLISNTPASSSTTIPGGSSSTVILSGTSTSSISINGASVGYVEAVAIFGATGNGAPTMSITGTASGRFSYAEYNVIS